MPFVQSRAFGLNRHQPVSHCSLSASTSFILLQPHDISAASSALSATISMDTTNAAAHSLRLMYDEPVNVSLKSLLRWQVAQT